MDNFYAGEPESLISGGVTNSSTAPRVLLSALLFAPLIIIFTTRYLSERPSSTINGSKARTVWMVPYWVPVIGHGASFLYNPFALMKHARNLNLHGIFALNLGMTTHNVSEYIFHEHMHKRLSEPSMVTNVLAQKESSVQFQEIAWTIVEKFFGGPEAKGSKKKHRKNWEKLGVTSGLMMKESSVGRILQTTMQNLETNIPQMVTFVDTEIDLQPWERFGKAEYISDEEMEVDLMALLRDMLGHASVPAFFGRALIDKYPNLLHDVYDMDAGMKFFLAGLPAWTPWPTCARAHTARFRLWQALDDMQRALDATAEGKPVDPSWGDLDDVSEIVLQRNKIFREEGFEIKERQDLSLLWALLVNANLIVYWQILYILSTPNLLPRILAEISPFVTVSKPMKIGSISEAPKLTISPDGLSKSCPLFKSTYLEALRMSSQPWSIRKIVQDVTITGKSPSEEPVSYVLRKGEYATIPHELHMLDEHYFKDPSTFDPERFLIQKEDGTLGTNIGTIRPYGGGPSMCKGRVYAEKECLGLVAGVLAYWQIEPVGEKGWVVPEQVKMSAVSKPVHDTRVRVRRRKFDWDG